MSKEQLLLYIYGIYPEGGISTNLLIVVFLVSLPMMFSYESREQYGSLRRENKLFYQVWYKHYKRLLIVSSIIWIIGYFIPSKNVFIAITATPTIINSLENGKLSKINKLLDLGLDKALDKLNKE